MKSNKISFIIFIVLIIFFTGACKKSFFTDVNINPNTPNEVAPNLILTTSEAALGYTQGGDLSRFTSLITQQVFGANSQSQSYYSYGLNPGVFDNLWPDLYTSTIINIDTLKNLADQKAYNAYAGIARILMAYTLQITVDCWGKIPYSQAVKGDGNFHPVYDDDKALYDTIASLVDAGISRLSDSHRGLFTPGADDGIYGGDAQKWIKFGHAIKARLYIHQSQREMLRWPHRHWQKWLYHSPIIQKMHSMNSALQKLPQTHGTSLTGTGPETKLFQTVRSPCNYKH